MASERRSADSCASESYTTALSPLGLERARCAARRAGRCGRRRPCAGRRCCRGDGRRGLGTGAAALAGKRACDGGGDRGGLDEDAAPEPVLRRGVRSAVGQAEDADVPVLAVRGRRRGDGGDNLDERVGAGGLPEADGAGAEIDVVGEVVPVIWLKLNSPLRLSTDIPAQLVVRRTSFSGDQAVLDLSEMTLYVR